jgi:hypothetical protein
MVKSLTALLLAGVCLGAAHAGPAQPAPSDRLYRLTLLRAAPGRLLDLLQDVNGRVRSAAQADASRPLVLRHSQGDHWDLFVLIPITSLASAADGGSLAASDLVAWQQDEMVRGPFLRALINTHHDTLATVVK